MSKSLRWLMIVALGVVIWVALDDITTGNETDLWLEWMVVGISVLVGIWLLGLGRIDKMRRNK